MDKKSSQDIINVVGAKVSDILQPPPLAHGFLATNDYSVGIVDDPFLADAICDWIGYDSNIIRIEGDTIRKRKGIMK